MMPWKFGQHWPELSLMAISLALLKICMARAQLVKINWSTLRKKLKLYLASATEKFNELLNAYMYKLDQRIYKSPRKFKRSTLWRISMHRIWRFWQRISACNVRWSCEILKSLWQHNLPKRYINLGNSRRSIDSKSKSKKRRLQGYSVSCFGSEWGQ